MIQVSHVPSAPPSAPAPPFYTSIALATGTSPRVAPLSLTPEETEALRYFAGVGSYAALCSPAPLGATSPTVLEFLVSMRVLRPSGTSYAPTVWGDEYLAEIEVKPASPEALDALGPLELLALALRHFPCFSGFPTDHRLSDPEVLAIIRASLEKMADDRTPALEASPQAHAARLALDTIRSDGDAPRFDVDRAWTAWARDSYPYRESFCRMYRASIEQNRVSYRGL